MHRNELQIGVSIYLYPLYQCRQIRGGLVGISAEISLILLFEILANFMSMLKWIS
jgi:hypothetical protein